MNWFDEEDPINHLVEFDNNKRPRSLYFGNNLDVSRIVNHNKLEQEIVYEVTQDYVNQMNITNNQLFQYMSDDQNNLFISQVDQKQLDIFQDQISHQLERLDRCDGFEMIIDCDSNYGSIGQEIINSLDDLQGCKSPKLNFALFDKQQQDTNIINRIFTLTQYKDNSSLLIPLYLDSTKLDFYNFMESFPLYQQLAFLINNVTSSYKSQQDHINLEEFYNRLVPMKQNNIFNLLTRIPLLKDSQDDNILNYKINLAKQPSYLCKNYQERVLQFEDKYESFGEAYFMRGKSPLPKENHIKSYGLDIRLIDYVYQLPPNFKGLFKNQEEDNIPMHTCLFSNECYKFTLLNYSNLFNNIKKSKFVQYQKQSLEQDISEIKHTLSDMIENYGGISDDEDNNDNDL